jgi:NNP family nitrate/nitrite transporter-like MFS transporter
LIPHVEVFSRLLLIFFAFGLLSSVYFPSSIPIITDNFEARTWGKAIGIHDTAASLSFLGAPFIAIVLLKFLAWRQFYYLFAAAYGICAVFFLFSVRELKVRRKFKGYLGPILKKKSLWVLGAIWTFGAGASMAIYTVTPLYLTKELPLSIGHANTVLGLSRLGGAVCAVLVGFVIDKYPLKQTLFVVMSATGIFTALMGYPNITVVQVALFLQGITAAGFFPVALVVISRTFDVEQRAVAVGTSGTIATVIGMALLPYLLGLAGDHLSFRIGILLFGLVVILSSGLVYFLKIPAIGSTDHASA